MYDKRKINKILIVDDSEMNRAILADMLGLRTLLKKRSVKGFLCSCLLQPMIW